MKIDKVEALKVDVPLDKSFGGGTYNVDRRTAIVTKIYTNDGIISEVFAGDDRYKSDIIVKCINEIFGPVLCILTAGTDEEGISMANDTEFGLQASIYTENVTNAHRYARAIRAGTVSVNCYSEGDITTPFGGYKLSGFGGKDNSLCAHEQYTETKTIWINISSDHVENQIN